jgi:putative tryptophan/tyrosine transport system substrate-binding protein
MSLLGAEAIVRRRDFITLLAAAAWPRAARAQQAGMPVIGVLSSFSETQSARPLAEFRRGLNDNGFTEGKNVTIESRFANGQYDRLPNMAAELVHRPVDLIFAAAPPAALAAKAATTSLPIVFVVGFDPVTAGLVSSLNRPGGNITGMTLNSNPLAQKRLEVLLELVPKASVIAMLVNPVSPDSAPEVRAVQEMIKQRGLELLIVNSSSLSEVDAAIATLAEKHPHALLVGSDPVLPDKARRNSCQHRAARAPRNLPIPRVRRGWWPDQLRNEQGDLLSSGRRLREPNSKRHKAR